jgi:hypothetical protein
VKPEVATQAPRSRRAIENATSVTRFRGLLGRAANAPPSRPGPGRARQAWSASASSPDSQLDPVRAAAALPLCQRALPLRLPSRHAVTISLQGGGRTRLPSWSAVEPAVRQRLFSRGEDTGSSPSTARIGAGGAKPFAPTLSKTTISAIRAELHEHSVHGIPDHRRRSRHKPIACMLEIPAAGRNTFWGILCLRGTAG